MRKIGLRLRRCCVVMSKWKMALVLDSSPATPAIFSRKLGPPLRWNLPHPAEKRSHGLRLDERRKGWVLPGRGRIDGEMADLARATMHESFDRRLGFGFHAQAGER